MNPINITIRLTFRLLRLTNTTPFAHNLTIRKTRITKSVETNSLVLSKLTEKKNNEKNPLL